MDYLSHGAIRLPGLIPKAYGEGTERHSQQHSVHRRCHHPHSLSRAPLANIDQVQTKLEEHQLKVNLAKYFFGNTEVAYLGFVLTPEGI